VTNNAVRLPAKLTTCNSGSTCDRMKLLHFGGPSLDVSRARARGLLFDEWPVLVDVQPKQAGEDHGRPFMWSGDGYLPDRIRTRVRSVGEQIDYGPASGHGASMPRSSAAF